MVKHRLMASRSDQYGRFGHVLMSGVSHTFGLVVGFRKVPSRRVGSVRCRTVWNRVVVQWRDALFSLVRSSVSSLITLSGYGIASVLLPHPLRQMLPHW